MEKAILVNQGCGVVEAETKARYILEARYGKEMFAPGKAGKLDPQIAKLEKLGFDISPERKIRLQAIMQTKKVNTADALRELGESEGLWNYTVNKQLETLGSKEAEYFVALSNADRRVLHGLKAAMPEANWTAKKFYKQEYGRGLPKPQVPEEPMVPRAEYEAAVKGFENLKRDFCLRHNVDPASLEAFLNE